MTNQGNNARKNEVRVELKYCERCGMLWMRECGSGLTYCNGCQPDVAELPILKKRPQSVKLGMGRRPELDKYSFDACATAIKGKPRGGVA
jgi:hypothetical protein